MCLAVPMEVIELLNLNPDADDNNTLFAPPLAVVERDGARLTTRLDVVDQMPNIGDFLIVHAGFAIRCLPREEALENLRLMQEMAQAIAADQTA